MNVHQRMILFDAVTRQWIIGIIIFMVFPEQRILLEKSHHRYEIPAKGKGLPSQTVLCRKTGCEGRRAQTSALYDHFDLNCFGVAR